MSFPFMALPVELAIVITSLAAQPELVIDGSTCTRLSHATAIALASVSYVMYELAMPHLVSTVVCNTTEQLNLFIHSSRTQRARKLAGSRLALDYTGLVRQFWATEIWEPLVHRDNEIDYRTLYDVLRGVECLGLSFHSLHLLYNALASAQTEPHAGRWDCHRLIVAGSHWRWIPLTSTSEGLAFLRQLTHLAVWVPYHRQLKLSGGSQSTAGGRIVPQWVSSIPFAVMPALSHFSFPLLSEMGMYNGTVIMSSGGKETSFTKWVQGDEFSGHCVEVPFEMPAIQTETDVWDTAYVQPEIENGWMKV